MSSSGHTVRVGSMRPSQLMWSYGVGAMVDLPRLSVMVEGLDGWDIANSRALTEERLLSKVRQVLGPQVKTLYEPPLPKVDPWKAGINDPSNRIGVPVGVFPRWLRCPRCGMLAGADIGVFDFQDNPYRPDEAKYVHGSCPKRKNGPAPSCVPARFLTACRAGHLDDFPWREYVHRGNTTCDGGLRFYEVGSSLETANLFVACDSGLGFARRGDEDPEHHGDASGCGMRPRAMSEAFGQAAMTSLPACRGRHPHLRSASEECDEQLKTILLGSSSSWFPKALSAISIPTGTTELDQAVEDNWGNFCKLESALEVGVYRKMSGLGSAVSFSDDEIWSAVENRLQATPGDVEDEEIKVPEWRVLSDPSSAPVSDDFLVTEGDVPEGCDQWFEPTILVEKIREVNALVGFTRLDPPDEIARGEEEVSYAPLSRGAPEWVPANEVRGEGILIRFKADKISAWENDPAVIAHLEHLERANDAWRTARQMLPGFGYPGHRYTLLHSFSHLLMRELALECGYSSASIRERIYASSPSEGDMCGLLIYTAAPDSEGTLGGLVRLGEAESLGGMIQGLLQHGMLCAADPLCSEHDPVNDRTLHGAACHACMFAPETSCEAGNRFLDRALVVPTATNQDVAFFKTT